VEAYFNESHRKAESDHAMEGGIADHVWSLEEIVDLLKIAGMKKQVAGSNAMADRSIIFPSQKGRLVVYHCEGPDQRLIGICGDPEGLRSLGELLIAEAELDQLQFPARNLPDGVGHHTHLRPGVHIHPQSLKVIVCRLDAKRTGESPDWFRASRMKRERPLREFLDDAD
jgi:hypothetical protein